MKKKLSFILVLCFTLILAACGSSKDSGSGDGDTKKLTVGASNVPHAEILEKAKPLLEEKGIDLEIEVFTDYVMPNKALADESIDANYFQHIPYFEQQVEENEYDFANGWRNSY